MIIYYNTLRECCKICLHINKLYKYSTLAAA